MTKMPFKRHENLLPLILAIIVFSYLAIYIIPTNIHGDGLYHTLCAREIVDTGHLLKGDRYDVLSSSGETVL